MDDRRSVRRERKWALSLSPCSSNATVTRPVRKQGDGGARPTTGLYRDGTGMSTSKVFGIGLSKTGTTSLANALELLGYRTKDYMGVSNYVRGDLSSIDLSTIDRHDALTDTPIPSFYRELDARYPGSKFVLTVRERAAWLKSCRKQFTQKSAVAQNDAHRRLFLDLYGTDVFDEQAFVAGYDSFVSGVREYFEHRPQDLLIMDVAGGDGWNELCEFLGRPAPEMPFPKANVTQIRWINIADITAIAREAGKEVRAACVDDRRGRAESTTRRTALRSVKDLLTVSKLGIRTFLRAVQDFGKDSTAAAEGRSQNLILRALARLTPDIPIVSPLNWTDSVQRLRLNHVWLVDPLSKAVSSTDMRAQRTVSIALIEDGKPIYGVVYSPASDTLYYAKSGQGAFMRNGRNEPHQLPVMGNHDESRHQEATNKSSPHIAGDPAQAACSPALAICKVAVGEAHVYASPGPVMEWEVAAAHAIARCVGKTVRDRTSNEELKYNKAELRAEQICVE